MLKVLQRLRSLGLAALLLGPSVLCFPNTAGAEFVHAYSRNFIDGFTISGGTMSNLFSRTTNSAEFQGFGRDQTMDPTDAIQARSGPGPFPGQNQFEPHGRTGQYARADALIFFGGFGGANLNVAEIYRTSPGSADAFATVTITFDLEQNSDKPILFSFNAFPRMTVATGADNDFSLASISFRLTLHDRDTLEHYLSWTPIGDPLNDFERNGGVVTDVLDPYSLNKEIFRINPGQEDYFRPLEGQDSKFSLGYKRTKGQKYTATVEWRENAGGGVTPEPSSVVLLGLGAAVLLGCAWRRWQQASRIMH